MIRFIKATVLAAAMSLGATLPAWAEMPQTDAQLIEAIGGEGSDKILEALASYYDLHVSEIAVQQTREHNVGAILAARRAEGDGDAVEAKRQMDIFESTKEALDDARANNTALRQELAVMTGIEFADDLVMAPDAPLEKPAFTDAPADLAKALDDAWAKVEVARAHLQDVRLQLLEAQEEYDTNRQVPIGDAMRAMTKAEVEMTRASCDLRLAVAKIASATGRSIGETLGGL